MGGQCGSPDTGVMAGLTSPRGTVVRTMHARSISFTICTYVQYGWTAARLHFTHQILAADLVLLCQLLPLKKWIEPPLTLSTDP